MSSIVTGALEQGIEAVAVIMAGGSGTRFWPLSRRTRPKQFLPLGDSTDSLLQQTAARLVPLTGEKGILVVTAESQLELVTKDLSQACVLAEPSARNTAPCIGLAAHYVQHALGDVPMICLPADHVVRGDEEIRKIFEHGCELARNEDLLITIGIKPSRPETGYGYIRRGLPHGRVEDGESPAYLARQFVEKPNHDTALSYVKSGEYYWNSGMFIWRPSVILAAIERFLPTTAARLKEVRQAFGADDEREQIARLYSEIEPTSIDVGVMERADNVVMLAGDSFFWSDIGSWQSWAEIEAEVEADEHNNVLRGDVTAIGAKNCALMSNKRLIAAVGVDDLIVIDTDDAVLVCHREKAQDVKKVIEQLQEKARDEFL